MSDLSAYALGCHVMQQSCDLTSNYLSQCLVCHRNNDVVHANTVGCASHCVIDREKNVITCLKWRHFALIDSCHVRRSSRHAVTSFSLTDSRWFLRHELENVWSCFLSSYLYGPGTPTCTHCSPLYNNNVIFKVTRLGRLVQVVVVSGTDIPSHALQRQPNPRNSISLSYDLFAERIFYFIHWERAVFIWVVKIHRVPSPTGTRCNALMEFRGLINDNWSKWYELYAWPFRQF